MKGLLSIGFIVLLYGHCFTQEASENRRPNYFYFSAGGGISSLQGYSILGSFSFQHAGHIFTLRGNLNNQTGHRKKVFLGYNRYNDRAMDLALLYGRAFRTRWLLLAGSAGPAFWQFNDKELGAYHPDFLGSYYEIEKNIRRGIGLAFQGEAYFLLSDDSGIGFAVFGDTYPNGVIVGASLNFVAGRLKSD